MFDVDYARLGDDLESGDFRRQLRDKLVDGFQKMADDGERLPPASYYATKIAEIVSAASPVPLTKDAAFNLYQETLLACEEARVEVLGEEPPKPAL